MPGWQWMGAVPIIVPQMAAGRVMVVMQEPERDALVPDRHDGDAEPFYDGCGCLIARVALEHTLEIWPPG